MEIDTHVIKELIAALDASRVDVLQIETDEFKLKLERTPRETVQAAGVQVTCAAPAPVCAEAAVKVGAPDCASGNMVTSPIVGTFYSAAAPDKPPFVKVGQQVKKGEILYIIESMKLMNEIASEFDGTVAEIFVKNGQGVEFGQPVMRIE